MVGFSSFLFTLVFHLTFRQKRTLNMKFKKIIALTSAVLLTACAYQPTPYAVVHSVDYKKGAFADSYKLGVSEQRVSDSRYFISARLDSGSSGLRAKQMVSLHAAHLAKENNFDAFTIIKARAGKWCNRSTNRATGQVSINDGGPTAAAMVQFISSEQSNTKRKFKLADKVISNLDHKVNEVISSEQAKENTNAMLRSCWETRF